MVKDKENFDGVTHKEQKHEEEETFFFKKKKLGEVELNCIFN